jgi:RsiW-degrading membrane proteinase PrsW (M82 family)
MFNGSGMIFFIIFAIALTAMYIALRREWFGPAVTTLVGTITAIAAMTLALKGDPDVGNLQALIFGFLIGTLFSGAILAVAYYFHSNELRGTSG